MSGLGSRVSAAPSYGKCDRLHAAAVWFVLALLRLTSPEHAPHRNGAADGRNAGSGGKPGARHGCMCCGGRSCGTSRRAWWPSCWSGTTTPSRSSAASSRELLCSCALRAAILFFNPYSLNRVRCTALHNDNWQCGAWGVGLKTW